MTINIVIEMFTFCFFSGWLFDETGSYAITFYSDGIILCLSSILLFIGYALNLNKQKKSRDTADVLNEGNV